MSKVIIYSDELYHHGVKGMKWGVRRYQNKDGSYTSLGEKHRESSNDGENRKGLTDKQKKALKIGAIAVGTALAAYGTYKLAKYIKESRESNASAAAQNYIRDNLYKSIGKSTFDDGTVEMYYVKRGDWTNYLTERGARNAVGKGVGAHNARVISDAKKMYSDATNTKLDKSLSKIIDAGDSVGKVVNNAKSGINSASNKTKKAIGDSLSKVSETTKEVKNKFLDVVSPQYEYKRVGSVTTEEIPKWFEDAVGPNASISGTKTKDIYELVKKRRS